MNKTIGIVGGGQLGKMLAEAGHKLGLRIVILEANENCPARAVADVFIQGSFKDKDKILELAHVSDVVTFEIESANAEALDVLVNEGKEVHPSPQILKIIKDKFNQKVFLTNHNIPVAEFAIIENEDDAKKQGEIFGYPYLLKARFDAYDGRGNFVVRNENDIALAFEKLNSSVLYAEKFVPFVCELAVVSARDTFGKIISYPVVETIHKNNICHIVRSPAPVSNEISRKAKALAEKVLGALSFVGVCAVEMFLTESGEVLVNEIAPRVHNSGHHTIEAFNMSQFEAHMRAVAGMHLSDPEPTCGYAVMVNILGEREGEALLGADYIHNEEGANVHIYGKLETRKERKMGHITALADTLSEAEEKALKARGNISI